MRKTNTIRVSEFEKLYFDDNKAFKQKHWLALCRYLERNREYFRILRNGIQFTNYVGVIQAGNLTIEVLPKTDRQHITAANSTVADLEMQNNSDAKSRQRWHTVLLKMLAECKLLQINHVDSASLSLQKNSILEIYFELFLAEAEKLLHEGLTRKYRKEDGNKFAIKGQLLFAKNLTHNLVHGERFYVRHNEYTRTNIFNQLIYKTLQVIRSGNNNPMLADKLNRVLMDFPEMPDCNVTATTFEKLVFDRKTERYKKALLISRMLLLNYRPDIVGGSENVMAILFDMNKLWEEFVYRRLKRIAAGNMGISRQNTKPFWYHSGHDYYTKIKPDIVITKGNRTVVLDTKWKMPEHNKPADTDLKQMFVYNLFWNAETSVLVYPGSTEGINGSYRHFNLSESKRKDDNEKFYNHCALFFLNILDTKGGLADNGPFVQLLKECDF